MKPFLIRYNYNTFVSITTVCEDTLNIKKLLNFIKTKRIPSTTGGQRGNFRSILNMNSEWGGGWNTVYQQEKGISTVKKTSLPKTRLVSRF